MGDAKDGEDGCGEELRPTSRSGQPSSRRVMSQADALTQAPHTLPVAQPCDDRHSAPPRIDALLLLSDAPSPRGVHRR